uniref:Coat protein n=1 Tax=Bemisia tabaci bromo-like virus 1 TaxID=2840001 RepID=A0A8E8KS15_9BROM|nr:coat protein [Bemisia tabaci bromo-like virus 1]
MPYQQQIPDNLLTSRWIKTRTLIKMIDAFERQNLGTRASKTLCLDLLNELSFFRPFSQNSRFPETSTYICLEESLWSGQLSNLRTLLSYKERPNDTNPSSSRERADQHVAIYRTLNAMRINAHASLGVYNRQTFEESLDLTWND